VIAVRNSWKYFQFFSVSRSTRYKNHQEEA